MFYRFYKMLMAFCYAFISASLFAQGLGQSSQKKSVEEMIVMGKKTQGALTSFSINEAKQLLQNIPGGIGFVEFSQYETQFTQSLGDALQSTPGVFSDTSAQRENRISIRGSGLNSTFERRGIHVYRDGIPITRASGITEFQEIDPLSIKYIEIYKGANGQSFGANALGGVLNVVTPTGKNSTTKTTLRAESGSFSTQRLHITSTKDLDNWDYYFGATHLQSNGFRNHSEVDSQYVFANVGFAISKNIESRFYVTALRDTFELAGSISLDDAINRPDSAVANQFIPRFLGGPRLFSSIDDDWDRNLRVYRIANRTTVDFSQWQVNASFWYARRELDHAITRFAGIIDQSESETGIAINAGNMRKTPEKWHWQLGVQAHQSDNDALVFQNIFGQRGKQTSDDNQFAENILINGQLHYRFAANWQAIVSTQHLYAKRENQHVPVSAKDTEDDSGILTFSLTSPTVGVLWELSTGQQVYANIGWQHETPGITDLTSGGALPFTKLQAQEAFTWEVGSRGQYGQWSWDTSWYRSIIENEFIDITQGFVTNTENSVSDTLHQGVEIGINWDTSIQAFKKRGWQLQWRHAMTYNDFRFRQHPLYKNNKLAGVPDFLHTSSVNIATPKWDMSLHLRHIPQGAYADFSNTVRTRGYTVYGVNINTNITPALHAFFNLENITNTRYIANASTVGQASDTSAIFTPGQGRGFFLGLQYELK